MHMDDFDRRILDIVQRDAGAPQRKSASAWGSQSPCWRRPAPAGAGRLHRAPGGAPGSPSAGEDERALTVAEADRLAVVERRLGQKEAAARLGLGARQARRLAKRTGSGARRGWRRSIAARFRTTCWGRGFARRRCRRCGSATRTSGRRWRRRSLPRRTVGVARDAAEVDGEGRAVASEGPSAGAGPPEQPRRPRSAAGAGGRFAARLVRGPRPALHADRVRGRRDGGLCESGRLTAPRFFEAETTRRAAQGAQAGLPCAGGRRGGGSGGGREGGAGPGGGSGRSRPRGRPGSRRPTTRGGAGSKPSKRTRHEHPRSGFVGDRRDGVGRG